MSGQPETMTIRVKGISHYQTAAAHCRIGDKVTLVPEPTNPYDNNAVRVDCHQRKIGYVPRNLAARIHYRVKDGQVTGLISDVIGERRSDFNLGVELKLTYQKVADLGQADAKKQLQQIADAPIRPKREQEERERRLREAEREQQQEVIRKERKEKAAAKKKAWGFFGPILLWLIMAPLLLLLMWFTR